jgi:hypothetical protein
MMVWVRANQMSTLVTMALGASHSEYLSLFLAFFSFAYMMNKIKM